jgi:hypothetical protein
MTIKKLCPRTLCIFRPGEPVEGMYCYFFYSGRIPCTGERRCISCGSVDVPTDTTSHVIKPTREG